MNPQLGREMAHSRMSDLARSVEVNTMLKQAKDARREAKKQTPPSQGRYVPAGALRLGRALRRLRSKPAQAVTC
jgi:hypothetical protein